MPVKQTPTQLVALLGEKLARSEHKRGVAEGKLVESGTAHDFVQSLEQQLKKVVGQDSPQEQMLRTLSEWVSELKQEVSELKAALAQPDADVASLIRKIDALTASLRENQESVNCLRKIVEANSLQPIEEQLVQLKA